MNYIAFDPMKLSGEQRKWWEHWAKKAETARLKVIEQVKKGEEAQFSGKIWSELKTWLLDNVFHGKCAYCESKVTVTEYGDADHYRPKGSIADTPNHTGYFWVAYDWRNLVPSCKQCNTGGKGNAFPVSGKRVFLWEEAQSSEILDALEQPLLLHPYNNGLNHPRKHLIFNRFGHVKARQDSERGRYSIEVYKLRRNNLKEARKKCQEHAILKFQTLLNASSEKRKTFLKKYVEGQTEYSAAVADCLLEELERQRSARENDILILQSGE